MRALALVTMTLTAAALVACGGAGGPAQEPAPAATAEPQAEPTAPELAGVEWVAVSIAGQPAYEEVRSTINFGDDGRAFGSAGCNSYQGGYQLGGDTLGFGPLAATRMYCEGPQQDQEDRFMVAIQAVARYEIAAGELRLHPADGGEPIRFTPAEAAAE